MALPRRFTDRSFSRLSIVGLCVVFFLIGAASMFYQVPVLQPLAEGLHSARVWFKATRPNPAKKIDPNAVTTAPALQETATEGGKNLTPARVFLSKELAYNGYTLICHYYSTTAHLVDMAGKVVHTWNMPFPKAFPNPKQIHSLVNTQITFSDAYAFPNGDLIAQYTGIGDTPYGYGLVKMDKNSNVIWTYGGNAHHSFYVDKENGNIYTIVHRMIKTPERNPEQLRYPLLEDYIVTLSSDGKEIDRISVLEAIRNSPYALFLYNARENRNWDLLHTNSVEKLEPGMANKFPLFQPGQLLISMRNMNLIAVLDRQSKKIVWAYQGMWRAQHSPRFLDNGHIMLLDNKGHVITGQKYSRLIEIDPITLEVTWYFVGNKQYPMHTGVMGRIDPLPNGNILIAEATKSRAVEITREGQVAWRFHLEPIDGKSNKKDLTDAVVVAKRYTPQELPFLSR